MSSHTRARDCDGRFNGLWECEDCGSEVVKADLRGDHCVECYVNETCPAQCSEDHDEPEPDSCGQWCCPSSGEVYRYDSNDGWEYDRNDDGSVYIDGEWVCDPYERDYTRCEHCNVWVHYDNTYCDDYGDASYCAECWRDCRNEDGYRESQSPRCALCNHDGNVTHHHPVTERVACATCIGDGLDGYERIDSLLEAA